MGREPDQPLRPDDLAGARHGNVVLADVHAVRIDLGCQRGIVIDDEKSTRGMAALPNRDECARGRVVVASLDQLDAAGERAVEHATKRRQIADQIQARRFEHAKPGFSKLHAAKCGSMDVMQEHDLIVVGGGLIGLTIAWRAAQRDLGVLVLERDSCAHGATRAAAGMLAPIAEIDFGSAGESLLSLALESAAAWPAFADELAAVTGEPSRLRTQGTLILARDRDEAEALERQLAHRHRLGLPVERLLASEARRLEPALVPTLRLALELPTEASVDPRWVCDALLVAIRAVGVELRERAPVAALLRESGRVRGVELANGERLEAQHVVLATGAWAGALANVPVRPVKGQIMLLRDPEGEGLISHTLRFEHGYLVPRADGIYALGASAEERGFDLTITARPLYELLRDASELVPGLLDLEVAEISAGLRPGSPDNLPLIGEVKEDGLILACGHYRNGILLAPLTATLVLAALAGGELPEVVAPARHEAGTVVA